MNTILRLSEVTKRILLTECSVGSWPKVAAHFNFLGVSYGHLTESQISLAKVCFLVSRH